MTHRLLLALIASAPLAAAAENLSQVYQDARSYDAQYAAAQQASLAGQSASRRAGRSSCPAST